MSAAQRRPLHHASHGPPPRSGEELRRWLEAGKAQLGADGLVRAIGALGAGEKAALEREWALWAHRGQTEPEGDWKVWLVQAGRGFGKTRAGAEWVWARARATPGARIALVGGNLDDVVKVMIEGPGGLVEAAASGESVKWVASRLRADLSNGASAFAYSAERPDKLRGPEHHYAWCDELAKWTKGTETWDNLMLGLRLGARPRAVVTTTPRTGSALARVLALGRVGISRGRTVDNPHLAADFRETVTAMYGGTRLGRQELDGELIEDFEGALWPRRLIEKCRGGAPAELARVVVGVDPPASADGDACGIVACGLGADGIGYVLDDASVSGLRPDGWARAVAGAAARWGADRVVAEANQGGDMVAAVLKGVDRGLPVRPVRARFGKGRRAEPVAALFERGEARFAGAFPALEDELAGLTIGGGYCGPGRSPDRADAMVWAMTELMLVEEAAAPRVLAL